MEGINEQLSGAFTGQRSMTCPFDPNYSVYSSGKPYPYSIIPKSVK